MRKRARSESSDHLQQNPEQRRSVEGANLHAPSFITPERTMLEQLESILPLLRNRSNMPGKVEILAVIDKARIDLTAIARENPESHVGLRQLYDSHLQFMRVVDEIENSLSSCEQLVSQVTALASDDACDISEEHITQINHQITWHTNTALPLLDRAESLKDGIIAILDKNFEDSDDDSACNDDTELQPLEARLVGWNTVVMTAIKEIYRTQTALQQPKDDFGLRALAKALRNDFKKLLQDFTGAMKKFERMHIKLLRYAGETVDSPDPTPPGSPTAVLASASGSSFFSRSSRSSGRSSESSDSAASANNQEGRLPPGI